MSWLALLTNIHTILRGCKNRAIAISTTSWLSSFLLHELFIPFLLSGKTCCTINFGKVHLPLSPDSPLFLYVVRIYCRIVFSLSL